MKELLIAFLMKNNIKLSNRIITKMLLHLEDTNFKYKYLRIRIVNTNGIKYSVTHYDHYYNDKSNYFVFFNVHSALRSSNINEILK
jgi:hypothetical protein